MSEPEKPPAVSAETRVKLEKALKDEQSAEALLKDAYRWITPDKKFDETVTTRITHELEAVKGIAVVDEDELRRKRQMKIAAVAIAILFLIALMVALFLLMK